jgi:hypothetical protein
VECKGERPLCLSEPKDAVSVYPREKRSAIVKIIENKCIYVCM